MCRTLRCPAHGLADGIESFPTSQWVCNCVTFFVYTRAFTVRAHAASICEFVFLQVCAHEGLWWGR